MMAAAMTTLGRWKGSGKGEEGSALLEMTVIIPFITVLGLGVLEFANYFYNFQIVQNGVQDAARYAASLPYSSSNTTQNDAVIKNLAVTGVPTGGTSRVPGWTTSQVTVTWSTVANTAVNGVTPYRYAGNVPTVTVSTAVPYSTLGFTGFMGLGSLTIKAKHEERVFGVR